MTFHHRPVLIFGKAGCRMKAGDSVLWIPSKEGSPTPGIGRLMQMATELVLKRLAEPGQKVCDPIMLDRPHSALTALELGCPFIGASHNSGCVDLIRKAVAQSRATGKADVGGGTLRYRYTRCQPIRADKQSGILQVGWFAVTNCKQCRWENNQAPATRRKESSSGRRNGASSLRIWSRINFKRPVWVDETKARALRTV